jgi:hypothetical protein
MMGMISMFMDSVMLIIGKRRENICKQEDIDEILS